jgi:uncharacterized protein HemX
MIPNLFEATKDYWQKLDQLEDAYQSGRISLAEVDREVATLMTELAAERRATLRYLRHAIQHWLRNQGETLLGLAGLAVVAYAWLITNSL